MEHTTNTPQNASPTEATLSEDYSRALTSARIAFYDDMRSAPRVTEIKPDGTAEFIENLASTTYTQAAQAGGKIPYTVIREVSENFIHAQFREVVVSIFDRGNTIRFADQGPGIEQKEKAQMPGFSSASGPMKTYIRGVGSGLPLVKEYLSFSNGRITIEDNLRSGAVVTISVQPLEERPAPATHIRREELSAMVPNLSDKDKDVLYYIMEKGSTRVTDLKNDMGVSPSTAHRDLERLEKLGLVDVIGKTRVLSEFGTRVVNQLF